MSNLRKFFIGLFLSFGAPWLIMVVIPALQAQWIQPLKYDKEADGRDGIYPDLGVYYFGERVYAREGCVQCHTQMIRPSQDGTFDQWKKGWGSDQSATPVDPTRASTTRDYVGEPYAYLGIQRLGPDLTNYGYRIAEQSDAAVYAHLYAPRAGASWSNMPNYRDLFSVQPIQGEGSPDALKLKGSFAPEAGYEVVPTDDAKELLKYLRSLKKDAPIPEKLPKK